MTGDQTRPLAGVVFDFDGLIADTESPALASWQELYAAHGERLDAEVWDDVIGTIGRVPDLAAELARRTGRPLDLDQLRERRRVRKEELDSQVTPLPGVAERLAEAHAAGLPVAVASSSSRRWVAEHLRRFGLDRGWTALCCADGDPDRAKPAPTLYREACQAMGTAPSDTVAFEDSPNGVAAATAAGLLCVAVPNPVTARLDLSRADLVLAGLAGASLAEIAARLDRALPG